MIYCSEYWNMKSLLFISWVDKIRVTSLILLAYVGVINPPHLKCCMKVGKSNKSCLKFLYPDLSTARSPPAGITICWGEVRTEWATCTMHIQSDKRKWSYQSHLWNSFLLLTHRRLRPKQKQLKAKHSKNLATTAFLQSKCSHLAILTLLWIGHHLMSPILIACSVTSVIDHQSKSLVKIVTMSTHGWGTWRWWQPLVSIQIKWPHNMNMEMVLLKISL